MRFNVLSLLCATTLAASAITSCQAAPKQKPIYDLNKADILFEKFVRDYNKVYTSEQDRKLHFDAFVRTLKEINERNSDASSDVTFGITKFADMTYSERAKMHGLNRPPNRPRRSSIGFDDHHCHHPRHSHHKPYDLENAEELFEKFIQDHQRIYLDEDDKKRHFEAFKVTLREINQKNLDQKGDVVFGITKFADFTEEDRARLDGLRHKKSLAGIEELHSKPIYDLEKAGELFEKFMRDFNRSYKDEEDKRMHFDAFKKTLQEINMRNSHKRGSVVFDINRFADYTHKERAKFASVGLTYRRRVSFKSEPEKSPALEEPNKPIYDLNSAQYYFEKFVRDYNRTYYDERDRQVHYEAFKKSLEDINRRNLQPGRHAVFDINTFADYTEEERNKLSTLKYRKIK